ncbi:hypothetical protein [Microvirga thermotolerans]|uniref:hypothetical protein n=1 Tax=Microvirga thermotolerans TaxID=2651334 RepID=UPI00188465ED|nr:hypothetical protein [Microvirga thermotolerans]
MAHHDHRHEPRVSAHAPHAVAAAPTFSLLRLSAGQRAAGAGLLLTGLWLLVLLVMG